jgi:hypothetical protein
MKRQTAKQRLGALASHVYSEIYAMTPRQRRAARRALEQLSQTNCGWTLYGMRGTLGVFLAMATPLRKRRKVSKEMTGVISRGALMQREPFALDTVAYGFKYDRREDASTEGDRWFATVQIPFRLQRLLLWPARFDQSCTLTQLIIGHERHLVSPVPALEWSTPMSLDLFWAALREPIEPHRLTLLPGRRLEFRHVVFQPQYQSSSFGNQPIHVPACNVGSRIEVEYSGGGLQALALIGEAVRV